MIPAQRPPELRRAADHLDARAEIEERQAQHGTEPERRARRARCYELRTVAMLKRRQADAIDRRDRPQTPAVLDLQEERR